MKKETVFFRRLAKRQREMTQIDDALQRLFTRQCGQHVFALQRLWKNWETVMGGEIASLGSPAGHSGHVLYVCAEDSMALQELKMYTPDIIQLANSSLGSPVFSAVSLSLRANAP